MTPITLIMVVGWRLQETQVLLEWTLVITIIALTALHEYPKIPNNNILTSLPQTSLVITLGILIIFGLVLFSGTFKYPRKLLSDIPNGLINSQPYSPKFPNSPEKPENLT